MTRTHQALLIAAPLDSVCENIVPYNQLVPLDVMYWVKVEQEVSICLSKQTVTKAMFNNTNLVNVKQSTLRTTCTCIQVHKPSQKLTASRKGLL